MNFKFKIGEEVELLKEGKMFVGNAGGGIPIGDWCGRNIRIEDYKQDGGENWYKGTIGDTTWWFNQYGLKSTNVEDLPAKYSGIIGKFPRLLRPPTKEEWSGLGRIEFSEVANQRVKSIQNIYGQWAAVIPKSSGNSKYMWPLESLCTEGSHFPVSGIEIPSSGSSVFPDYSHLIGNRVVEHTPTTKKDWGMGNVIRFDSIGYDVVTGVGERGGVPVVWFVNNCYYPAKNLVIAPVPISPTPGLSAHKTWGDWKKEHIGKLEAGRVYHSGHTAQSYRISVNPYRPALPTEALEFQTPVIVNARKKSKRLVI